MTEFHEKIKSWVTLDNELSELTNKSKEIRTKRNELTANIKDYVKDNNLETAVVKITNGRLEFKENNVTQPLTLTFIKEGLNEIISNTEQVDMIMTHIKDRRERKLEFNIKRFGDK